MRIKTVKDTTAREFDQHVNDALAEGWFVHELIANKGDTRTTFVAFLFREDNNEKDGL